MPLLQVLDLCSDEDLEQLYAILYGPSPFSPIVKTLVAPDEPVAVQQRGRASVMHKAGHDHSKYCKFAQPLSFRHAPLSRWFHVLVS